MMRLPCTTTPNCCKHGFDGDFGLSPAGKCVTEKTCNRQYWDKKERRTMAIHEADVRKTTAEKNAWRGFVGHKWKKDIDVRDFIQQNVTPYYGNDEFLASPTEATTALWDMIQKL